MYATSNSTSLLLDDLVQLKQMNILNVYRIHKSVAKKKDIPTEKRDQGQKYMIFRKYK